MPLIVLMFKCKSLTRFYAFTISFSKETITPNASNSLILNSNNAQREEKITNSPKEWIGKDNQIEVVQQNMIICKKCKSNRFPKWQSAGKMTVYFCQKCGDFVDIDNFVVKDDSIHT